MMRRRLYFLMPDNASARATMNDLLLARIEERHIHFLAKRGTPMDGLHEANVLQKSDLVQSALRGLLIGAVLGCITGFVVAMQMPVSETAQIVSVLAGAILGAVFGGWVSSMIGASVPNSRLLHFQEQIERGSILLIVDVPAHRLEEIRELLHDRHPEAADRGIEPRTPAFP
jgi:hypothetical protein